MTGAVFFTAEFSAPWGYSAPPSHKMTDLVAPGAEHLVIYHLLIDGDVLVEMPDGQTLPLHPGDVVILPHGHAHNMSSGQDVKRPFPDSGISGRIRARNLRPLQAGGGGAVSRLACGYLSCDPNLCRPILRSEERRVGKECS